ncbi:MAG: Uma2 family endonuclease [Anaerolineae bacterium]
MDNAITRIGMPLHEFIEEGNTQPFELINGERRYKAPTVYGHSKTLRAMFRALDAYVVSHELGEVFSETTFILPEAYDSDWVKGSRIPDIMLIMGQRLAEFAAKTPDAEGRPIAVIPDLVIEVVSPTDKASEFDEKVDMYLADGVQWVITLDPQRRKAHVYSSDSDHPIVLKGDAILRIADLLPGFEVPLRQVFE